MVRKSGSRRRTVVVAGVLGLVLAGGAAFAYWTSGGGGNGAATTKGTVADIVVTQTTSTGNLAPGESVPLSGLLTNPNNTDVKVGTLTAEIISATNTGVSLADFSLTGNPVTVNAVVKKGAPLTWSGMSLNYANSDVNQDNAKNTTVTIRYTLTPFVENVVIPMGTKTVTTVNGVRTVTIKIDNIGGVPLVPGQQLMFYHGSNAPNGYACSGTTSTYCNVTAPAPTVNIYGQIVGNNTNPVNATLPTVDANGVLTLVKAMTVQVQWQFVGGPFGSIGWL